MSESKIEIEYKKTLEKIGRNIINFQHLETGLKYLISRCVIHGDDVPSLTGNIESTVNKYSKKTLGNLVGEYLDRIYQGAKINNGSVFLMQFSVEADKEFILDRKLALENLVAQRNQLVHHRLIELDSKSISSCKKLSAELD